MGISTTTVLIAVAGILIVGFVMLAVFASRYRRVGPNEVLVISGRQQVVAGPATGQRESVGFRIVKGGGTFVWPLVERVDVLSLEVLPLQFRVPEIYAKGDTLVTVEGVAQVKIKGDADSIRAAAEHFLSKSPDEIEEIAQGVLVGHVQTTLGAVTVEEIQGDRDAFARRVRERWAEDIGAMGLEVISFVIRDVREV